MLLAVDPSKDVDGFHPVNVGKLATGDPDVLAPCTPAGVVEMLMRSGVDPSGKHAVVVGRSNIVGRSHGFASSPQGSGRKRHSHRRPQPYTGSRGRDEGVLTS